MKSLDQDHHSLVRSENTEYFLKARHPGSGNVIHKTDLALAVTDLQLLLLRNMNEIAKKINTLNVTNFLL